MSEQKYLYSMGRKYLLDSEYGPTPPGRFTPCKNCGCSLKEHEGKFCPAEDDVREQKAGEELAKLLYLKKNRDGRYNLTTGDKTALGLFRTIKRFIEEHR